MLKLVVLCCVFVVYISAHPMLETPRIVNGTRAKLGEIPYIVSVRERRQHHCGGTILDNRHILTAAHCVISFDPKLLRIQYGELNIWSLENIIPVEKVYPHEEYAPSKWYANDIAVLKLAEDIPYSKYVQPVKLPLQDEKPPGGNVAVVSGWGLNKSGGSIQNFLQKANIFLYTDEQCKIEHGSRVDFRYHVCAAVPEGGRGECNGDSGGPLISNEKQWGVVSWSIKPCTLNGPSVFARVPSYINWIKTKQLL